MRDRLLSFIIASVFRSVGKRMKSNRNDWHANSRAAAEASYRPWAGAADALSLNPLAAIGTLRMVGQECGARPARRFTSNMSAAELRTHLLRFETALERMSHGVCFFDGAQRLVLANRRYAELYDLPPDSIRPGLTLQDIIMLRFENGSSPHMTPEEYLIWRREISARNQASETVVEMANGRTIMIKHQPMPDGGWVSTHEDITEQQRAAARIAHMAHHDALTGLANRVLFRKTLDEATGQEGWKDGLALLCLDLDRFKQVNDTLGHPLGDLLLRAVTGRLLAQVDEGCTVARLGGDEFAIISKRSTPQEAADLAARVVDTLGRTFELEGHRAEIGASIGIAIAPRDGAGPDELLRNADLALYRAKAAGRGCFRFLEPETDLRLRVQRSLEQDLRSALGSDELELYYQPLVEVPTRQVLGFEALLRWRHPERGLIMPHSFINLAERADLIIPLGNWVVHRACMEAVRLPGRHKVAVNVSPLQLTPDFPAYVAAALKASGLAPARLELEITETAMLRETEATLAVLHGLRDLGVGIAMDDFGTGFSSLSALQRFPFTKVKIDRAFIRSLGQSDESTQLLRAIVDLCRVLRMPTIAEGIETEEQFAAVIASGCCEAQGYLLGRPMHLEKVLADLTDQPDSVGLRRLNRKMASSMLAPLHTAP
jgi:diguanylate cyclase (GGDEF)-like protein